LECRRHFSVSLIDEIHDTPPADFGQFGQVMATRGDLVLVGLPNTSLDIDNDTLDDSGIGQVKLYNTATGNVYTIANPEPNVDDLFGSAVTFVGTDKIAVTSIDNPSGAATGSVYIYNLVGGVPSASPAVEITGGGSGAVFGGTLNSVGGDILIADTQGGPGGIGVIHRYTSAGTFVRDYTFGSIGDALGQRIAVNEADGHILATARGVNGAGIGVEFQGDGDLAQVYVNADASAGEDFFGVAFNGTKVLLGDIFRDRVLEFDRAGGSVLRTISNPEPSVFTGENFGQEIVVSGNKLVITAPANLDDATFLTDGIAYVYDATSGANNPAPIETISNPTASASNEEFGSQIGVLANGNFVISDPSDDFDGLFSPGGIYVLNVTLASSNANPVANAGGDQIVVRSQTVSFNGNGSSDSDGTIIKYEWDFNNDGIVDFTSTTPTASTSYATAGLKTVKLTVTDDDNATSTDTLIVDVRATLVTGGTMYIGGGTGTDTVVINGSNVIINGSSTPFAGNRVIVYGGAGSDVIGVVGNSSIALEAHGGEGNDVLSGGKGADILVGDAGNDVIHGADGRDLLIGGSGSDVILGLQEDDILIAGSTRHDNDSAALGSIRSVWTGAGSFSARVNLLLAGPLTPDSDVFDDNAIDVLTGNGGTDWFIFNNDGPNAHDIVLGENSAEAAAAIDILPH
jgi:PKD repeat protein